MRFTRRGEEGRGGEEDGIEERREGDIKTFDDHEGIYLFLFWRRRTMIVLLKRSSSFARTYLSVCERGDCNMLALALSHTH